MRRVGVGAGVGDTDIFYLKIRKFLCPRGIRERNVKGSLENMKIITGIKANKL